MRARSAALLGVAVALAALCPISAQAQTISIFSTYPAVVDPTVTAASSAFPVGQSFTDPVKGNNLFALDVWMVGTGQAQLSLYAMPGLSGIPSGPALYTSALVSVNAGATAEDYVFMDDPMHPTILTPGDLYIAIINEVDGKSGVGVGFTGDVSTYDGGAALIGAALNGITTDVSQYDYEAPPVTANLNNPDFAVRLVFDISPEPGTLALMATGLLGLFGFTVRRRHQLTVTG